MNLVDIFQNSKNILFFSSGEIIFSEGDPGDISCILLEGNVDVLVRGRSVHVAQPGEVLGIMALIDENPRSASLVALDNCKVATLNREEFLFLVEETPYFAIHMMEMLYKWLRHMDASVQ